MKFSRDVSIQRKSAIIIGLTVILAIAFETFQQIYYIRKFDLAEGVSFFTLLKNQSYRWIVWLAIGLLLLPFSRRFVNETNYRAGFFLRHLGYILALVVVNILIISFIQLYLDGNVFTFRILIQNYITFYVFQKAPIFTLGYIAISVILHLHFLNQSLQIQVQKLSELKENNLNLYNKLKSEIGDKTEILNIKIGNRHKIIPVTDIVWIEADDYCARVHLSNGKSYSMRSSLKTLQEKLQASFLRVHRKALVNMEEVKELENSESVSLILKNEVKIPVSKSKLKAVKDFFQS
ncbi:MAG TPA: LytTR family DNA-binding domain-containing protein [Flavobacteriaceae bacterium]|nr:LytTR family transcriptional regulator [Flavobacteriaceae bacterium]MCB9212977.1 LytTR family transcriptional regulator [Alteromonas sp.]HPF11351.1 LytTR family DNA-binding domain-containing protein [Flavobacteriaceae bacterium]HQU20514.1 LytTR family DNA-binding domain-containing protein [Flavobacteriaceae bacterium]HQU65853.1 LytTR family DNA-binding domain-containing protein [Flavobacteriaceae bacterium]